MLNQTSTTAIVRIVLLAGILLALAFLASRSFFPAFAQEEIEFPENGTDPVVAFAATDQEGDSVTWSVIGTDMDDFSITNGVLTFKNPPDFESPTSAAAGTGTQEAQNVYTVMVQADDGNDGRTTETVTVEVTNVEEDGVITMSGVQPKEKVGLTATLSDDDDVIVDPPDRAPKWQWATSTSPTGPWNDIDHERARSTGLSHTFTPTENDVGSLLQATVTYMDEMGEDDLDTDIDESLDKAVFTFDDEDRRVLMDDYSNDAPVFKTADDEPLPTTSRSVAENSQAGTNVGKPVVATDNGEDGMPETLTYTLTDASGLFVIGSSDGQIKVGTGATLDYDIAPRSYEVTVTATDPSDLPGTIMVTINLTDVDEPPMFTEGDEQVDFVENTDATDEVETYQAADAEDDVSPPKLLKWSLASGRDSSKFEINPSGVLTFRESPNFEAPTDAGRNNVYNVTVNVTDSGGNTASRAVAVTVTDAPENEIVTLSNRQAVVGKRITANFNTGENKGDDVTNIEWVWSTSTTDPIQGVRSNSYQPRPVDANGTLTVRVNYTDANGTNTNATENVPVLAALPENTAPRFEESDQEVSTTKREVEENPPAAGVDVVGVVSAVDDDSGGHEILTYTMTGGSGLFEIDRETGQISVTAGSKLDRETTPSYRVTVTATDPSLLSDSITVTIEITDEPEGPFITQGAGTTDYAENGTVPVETYRATDPEDDKARRPLTWSITGGADSDLFDIGERDGVLRFKQTPDFEDPQDGGIDNEYSVTVTVSDNTVTNNDDAAPLSAVQTVMITVTDAEENGTITLPNLQPKETIMQSATLTDPDGGPGDDVRVLSEADLNLTAEETTKWQWARSRSSSRGWTDIGMATSSIYTPVKDDVGSYLRVTATYLDRRSENAEDVKEAEAITANVVQAKDYVNEPPKFPDQDPSMMGDQTDQKRKVAENSSKGTNVGAPVAATDLGRSGTQEPLVFKLFGAEVDHNADDAPERTGDARIFAIDNDGQLSIATTTLDYEDPADEDRDTDTSPANEPEDNVYQVQVKAIDPTMASTTIDVFIRVTRVDEPPKFTDPTETVAALTATSTGEMTATTTTLSAYMASDDEDGAPQTSIALKWSLAGADKDWFVLCDGNSPANQCDDPPANDNTVHLRLKAMLNFEARADAGGNNVYNVTLVATDSDDMSATRDVAVTVTNDDEDGIVTLSNVQPEVGTAITATLSDPDGGETGVTWQWETGITRVSMDDAEWDPIRGATSRTYTPVAEDVGNQNFLRATARYTDNVRPKDDPTTQNIDESQDKDEANGVTYHVVQTMVDGNRPPAFGDQDPDTPGVQDTQVTIRVNENAPAGTSVGTSITANDGDEGELTYTLEGTDASLFEIGMVEDTETGEADVGLIRVGEGTKLDYETRSSYSVTVRATDPAGASDTISVAIEVIPLNEAPEIITKGLVVSGDASVRYEENRTDSVATYIAQGSDANRVSWSLSGTDASAFSVASGVLSFNSAPNFEAPTDSGTDNVYNVVVRAVGGTISASKDVTVTVSNVDEDGTVNLSSPGNEVKVGVVLTAELDERDDETNVTWQWSSGSSNTGPWANISGETNNTYTPVDGDVGNFLRITVSYTDATFGSDSLNEVTASAVVAAAVTPPGGTPGTVALSPTTQLTSGDTVTATLTDADNPVASSYVWRWERSADGSTNWSTISAATSASYTTGDADAGNYLRASVTYDDSSGTGKTASPVATADRVKLHRYDDNANGLIERSEVIEAIRDFLFHRTITRDQVIQVIRLYLTR